MTVSAQPDGGQSAARRSATERGARVAVAGLWLLIALYTWSVLTVPRPEETGYHSLWDGWVSNVLHGGSAALIILRAITARTRRAAYWWLGMGALVEASANLVYLFHDQNLDPVPFPALSDVPYLASYVGLILGVVLLTQGKSKVASTVRIDGLIVAVGVAAVAAPFVFQPALAVSGNAWEAGVGLAYPLLDLILLILLSAGIFSLGYRLEPATIWLVLGVLAFSGGDIAYLAAEAQDTYVQGTLLDVTWAVGLVCFATAAWSRNESHREVRTEASRALVFLPVVAAAIALAVPAMQIVVDVPPAATGLAVVAIAAVLLRLGLSLRDVSRLLLASRQARTDELTTLPNRRGFFELLDRALADKGGVAVLLFDLDGFKDINDTLGHAAGDELLLTLSLRLRNRMPAGTSFARLGGDEFAAILPINSELAAVGVARELTRSFHEPVLVDGVPVRVGASCGISLSPIHGSGRSELLRAADVAMYQAKRTRTGVVVYQTDNDPNDRDRLQRIEELRDALDHRQFELHYQPQVSFGDGMLTGAEALVRWHHPTLGLLPPLSFIPLLEQAGLLPRLTRIVVDEAVAFAATFGDEFGKWSVSVNVSAQDLLDDALPAVVTGALVTHGLDGSRLTLEITEDAIVRDPERARRLLDPLRAVGVKVAVDDFGTGYQSLGQLLAFDLDEVKLDRSLVADVAQSAKSQAVVRAMASLAASLGLQLVAEGVETTEALDLLGDLGCTTVQGFLLAHPVPGSQLAAEVRRVHAERRAARPPGSRRRMAS